MRSTHSCRGLFGPHFYLAFMNLRASPLTNSVAPSRLLRALLIWASRKAGWEESTATTREAPPAAALSAKPPL